ncbi:MAG: hypothetical protein VX470_06605 [Planctomycetota bacterium]|nr:hypothetical protein [Planctomycetota bacterium]
MKFQLGVVERTEVGAMLPCLRFDRLTLVFLCVPILAVKVPEAAAFQNEESQLIWSDPLDWQDAQLYRAADLRLIELANQAENYEVALWVLEREGVVSKADRSIDVERRGDQEVQAGDRRRPVIHLSPRESESLVNPRLGQLLQWQAIQHVGLYELMLSGRWDEYLQLSPKDLAAFETDYRAAIRALQADCRLLEKRIRNELLAVLTESQRRQWDVRYGRFEGWDESMHIGPGQLFHQLRHSSQATILNESLGVQPDLKTDRHLIGFGDHAASVRLVESLVRCSYVQRELALSLQQIERLERSEGPPRQWLDQRESMSQSVRPDEGKPATNATRVGGETKTKGLNIPSDIARVLGPEQERKLREMIQWNHFRRVGWLPVLTDGSLGYQLAVSSRQRSQLFSKAKTLQDEVIRTHSEMVEKLLAGATRSFSKTQLIAFTAILGDCPSPPLLLQPLREIGFFHQHLLAVEADIDGEFAHGAGSD